MTTAPARRPGRLASWQYALTTTNPPKGVPIEELDGVTRWLVVTRAAVLPMTLGAGLVAGLLAIGADGFSWFDLVLAVVGIVAAHLSNNLMNDLFDTSGRHRRRDLSACALRPAPDPLRPGHRSGHCWTAILAINVADLVILVVLTGRAAGRWWRSRSPGSCSPSPTPPRRCG